jgi:hypothetical protein
LCEIKSIRKPRRSILLFLCNTKCGFHAIKCHTENNPKLQNIAMLLKSNVLNNKNNKGEFEMEKGWDKILPPLGERSSNNSDIIVLDP